MGDYQRALFEDCPNKVKWPKHVIIDKEVKATYHSPTLSSENSFLSSCHMMENNNLIKIIPFIFYLLLKFAPELLLSTSIRS